MLLQGTNRFNRGTELKIRSLLFEKLHATKSRKKAIRQELRDVGFFITDWEPKYGFTLDHFELLKKSGQIVIYND